VGIYKQLYKSKEPFDPTKVTLVKKKAGPVPVERLLEFVG